MMSAQVHAGAMLLCSCGLSPSLLATGARLVKHTQGPPLATISDCLPMVHVPPFGTCSAPANPSPLFNKPCMPCPVGMWSATGPVVMVAGVPVLTQESILPCAYGGVIAIVLPGPPGLVVYAAAEPLRT